MFAILDRREKKMFKLLIPKEQSHFKYVLKFMNDLGYKHLTASEVLQNNLNSDFVYYDVWSVDIQVVLEMLQNYGAQFSISETHRNYLPWLQHIKGEGEKQRG